MKSPLKPDEMEFIVGRVITTILSLVIAILLAPPPAEARGRRAKVKKTPEELVQSCLTNTHGLKITVRKLLNERRNRLAENVDVTDWNKYCACFAPKANEIDDARPPGNLGRAEYQKLTDELDALSESCANKSIPASVAAPAPLPTPKPDSRFDATLQHCKSSPKGYLTVLEVHLKVRKSPRVNGVAKMSVDKYCECYVRSLRQRLGDDMAHKELTTMTAPADKDIMKVAQARDETYDICAAEQIPFE